MEPNAPTNLEPLWPIPDADIPRVARTTAATLAAERNAELGRAAGTGALGAVSTFCAGAWLLFSAIGWSADRALIGIAMLALYAGCAFVAYLMSRKSVTYGRSALSRRVSPRLRGHLESECEIEEAAAKLNGRIADWNARVPRRARSRPDALDVVVFGTERKALLAERLAYDKRLLAFRLNWRLFVGS